MTNPGSLLNFMNLRRLPGAAGEALSGIAGASSPATWDPSVLLVFATALGTQLPLYQLFVKDRKECLTGTDMPKHVHSQVDLRLISGAALFGAGWALAGFCPGPALSSAFAGAPNAAIFVGATIIGMTLFALSEQGWNIKSWLDKGRSFGLHLSLAKLAALSAGLFAFRKYATPIESVTAVKLPTDAFPPLTNALAGGALIGLSGFLFTLALGKVMGLSGMISHQLNPHANQRDRFERWFFLLGLGASALTMRYVNPAAFISSAPSPQLWKILLSGLMVGFGTASSNGCTSGHGLSGISRFALRSIIATATFFGTNVLVSTFLL